MSWKCGFLVNRSHGADEQRVAVDGGEGVFTFGLPQSLAPSTTVLNFHFILPVAASSVHTTPNAPPLFSQWHCS